MKGLSSISTELPVQGVRLLMDASANIPDAIHLEVGEPNVNTPLYIRKAAEEAMQNEYTHYAPNAGLTSLRESIVDHMKTKYNLDTTVNNVAVTAGAVNALMVSLLAIVDRGEEVLIPDPAWPNYEMMLKVQGAIPKRYELLPERNFTPDVTKLDRLVTEKTKAIMINSPGNPTGAVYDKNTLKEIIKFAKRHDLYVISDEVYDEIVFEEEHVCVKNLDEDDRVVSIYSFSKSYAMTGWRVGYAIASEEIIGLMTRLIEPVVSCAPSFAQKAAEVALKESDNFLIEMRDHYKKRRDNAFAILEKNNVRAYKPKGTFYMLIDMSSTNIPSDKIAFKLLEEEKVSVGPGTTFGETTKDMIRISLATEESELLEGVQRICDFIKKYEQSNL